MHSAEMIGLTELGIVRMRGPDVVPFLQGQLSADVEQLSPERSLLAGYHNPQGRVIALLRLIQLAEQDFLAVVPRELAGTVAARLSRYILRSKVKVVAELDSWRISGLVGGGEQRAGVLPGSLHALNRAGECLLVQVGRGEQRWLLVRPADEATPELGFEVSAAANPEARWQRLEVADGLPQVYAATSEQFVAQMLNLDALGAIAFEKGCYTGQEVIARAHYRGRVKRRMQRFVTRMPGQLSAGDSGQLPDGRSFKVVLAATLEDGRCDFLAVTALPGSPGSAPDPQQLPVSEPGPAEAATVLADPAPLPYTLPE